MSATIEKPEPQNSTVSREERQRYRAVHYPKPGDSDYQPQWDPKVMEKYAGQCIVYSDGKIVSADVDPQVAIAKAACTGCDKGMGTDIVFYLQPGKPFPAGLGMRLVRFPILISDVAFEFPSRSITALRPRVKADLFGFEIQPYIMFDTGAPFSVLSEGVITTLKRISPKSLIEWDIPKTMMRIEEGNPEKIGTGGLQTWEQLPCSFGELIVQLRYRDQVSNSLTIAGKWVRKSCPLFNNNFILLGMSFLSDNEARLHIETTGYNASGYLELP